MFRKSFVSRKPLHTSADSLQFGLYSSQEVRSMSVVKIQTPIGFNALGHPLPSGLYDPALGPYDMKGVCSTCQQTLMYCPGHFGHIELPLPCLNPLFTKTLLQIFRLSCLYCHSLTLPAPIKQLCVSQLKLLSSGFVKEAQEAETLVTEVLANVEEGKKISAKMTSENIHIQQKLDEFLEKTFRGSGGKKKQFDITTQNIESLRRSIYKRVLSYCKMNNKCHACGSQCKKIILYESRIVYTLQSKVDESGGTTQKYLTPLEARDHLRAVWEKEPVFLSHMFPVLSTTTIQNPTDLFFVEVVAVPPPKNRPAQYVNNQMVDHPQNLCLRSVISSATMMLYALQGIRKGLDNLSPEIGKALSGVRGNSLNDKVEFLWTELQHDVDHLMDSDKGSGANQKNALVGLKQVIEKKEGLFRMHMMGKRVNFAARTVITPDPNLHIEEIGIPDIFAKTLTYPTPVTHWNVNYLRRLIVNGPEVHPGAVAVENEAGQINRLSRTDINQRRGIAARLLVPDKPSYNKSFSGIKSVHRHLENGDLLLLNRQPSLHRPSIMAHRARVLYGDKVFRLHYANCKHYNADFDGDEMNAHFPQSSVARSEAANLVNVCNHFLVPKDGTPLGGLIQDHVVAGVKMTMRGRFFSRDDYQALVYFALSNYTKKIHTVPPAIWKPYPLWSGKQVISTIVINLVPDGRLPPTFTSSAKIKPDEWRQQPSGVKFDHTAFMSESNVVFLSGELLSGILDKVHLGATPYGLCHTFYELYGSQAVGDLLSAFSRVMTNFLHWEGFTLGVKDVLVKGPADKQRRGFMVEASEIGPIASSKGVGLPKDSDSELITERLKGVHHSRDVKSRAIVDQAYKETLDQYTNKINKSCLPYGLVTTFPINNLQLLVQSGAKGSTVNTMQMSCLLGQIELEGKRPPLTIAGKSLPSFKPYDPSPRAGGFISGRFLTGIRPQEFFFHCMAGREGLIDTAVKTSRSGYLQRCLVKLLEGLVVNYDGTVRDSDGSVVQYLYGEDGLDVSKAPYLKPKLLDFIKDNSKGYIEPEVLAHIKAQQNDEDVKHTKRTISEWKETYGSPLGKERRTAPIAFFDSMSSSPLVNSSTGYNETSGRSHRTESLLKLWIKLSKDEKEYWKTACAPCPDPVQSKYRPDSHFGSISESLEEMLGANKKLKKSVRDIVYYKAMKALSEPGDAVGILAAQSIGEPSTQMTLNTFHFAGRGEMNVTLGIPRLREILMVAAVNIKTPSMDIPFLPHVTPKQAETLRLQLTKVTLAQILEYVKVTESLDLPTLSRILKLEFVFLDLEEYSTKFAVKPSTVLRYMERSFIPLRLVPSIRKALKSKRSAGQVEARESRKFRWAQGPDQNRDIAVGLDDDNNQPRNMYEETEKHGMGEDHQSSDEEGLAEDADATQSTRAARHQEREYEEPEEDEVIPAEPDIEEEDKPSSLMDVDEPESEHVEDDLKVKLGNKIDRETYASRISTMLTIDPFVLDYEFDRVSEQSCTLTLKIPLSEERLNMDTLLREQAGRGVIHEVPDISRAFISGDGKQDPIKLKTEGINILAISQYRNLLDLNRLYCNNIHVMAQHYGIESAAKVIVKEMTDVFKAYGIALDPRHLTLVADYMTFSGTYRPFNRHGIESSSSPLHQMSFETVVSFLRDATLTGRCDGLSNPSARLVVGKPASVGTGLFDVHQKISVAS